MNGFRDIHESLEAAMAHKEIETISSEATQKSGQEVCIQAPCLIAELGDTVKPV